MSIQSEITRLNDAKTVLKNWLTSQSVQTAVNANLTAIAEIIAQLEIGGSMETLSGTIDIYTLENGIYLVEEGSTMIGLETIYHSGMLIVGSRGTTKTGLLFGDYYYYDGTYTMTLFESNEVGNTAQLTIIPLTSIATKDDLKPTTYNVTGSATSVSSASNKTIATLKIPAGTYIVNAHVSFAANTTGVRKIYIGTTQNSYANTRALADTRPASNHQATMSNMSTILNVEEETTYYLNVYQNSGSSLSCSGSLRATRIGDYAEYQSGL